MTQPGTYRGCCLTSSAAAVAAGGVAPGSSDAAPADGVPADPRIDAIVAMAPASSAIPDETFEQITVPSLVITGTNDQTTPLDPDTTRPFDLLRSGYRYRVDLIDGVHQSFTDLCTYPALLPTLEDVPAFIVDTLESFAEPSCRDGQMPIERAHELTRTYVTAFLLAHLADQDAYRLLLTDDAASVDDDVVFFTR